MRVRIHVIYVQRWGRREYQREKFYRTGLEVSGKKGNNFLSVLLSEVVTRCTRQVGIMSEQWSHYLTDNVQDFLQYCKLHTLKLISACFYMVHREMTEYLIFCRIIWEQNQADKCTDLSLDKSDWHFILLVSICNQGAWNFLITKRK